MSSVARPQLIPPSIDFVWETGLTKIRDQIEIFDTLDSKIGVIVGFVVVSIVELLGFLLLAGADTNGQIIKGVSAFSLSVEVFFGMGLVCSFLSTVAGLVALRVRAFAVGVDYEKLVSGANLENQELKTLFLGDLVESVRKNMEVLKKKAWWATASSWLVLAGLLCYTVVVAQIFMCFVPRG
jgi:hypothetical protein